MMKRDYKFMEIAKSLANCSTYDRVHIGAVVAHRNSMLGGGFNIAKTHPRQFKLNKLRQPSKHQCASQHAEFKAILNSHPDKLKGSTIYVYREDVKGNLAMCRPCNACMKIIKDAGIKKMVYTTPDGIAEEILF